FLFLRCLEKTSLLNAFLLGASLALGMLSKYNFAIFILSLGILILWNREYRLKLRKPQLWAGLFLGSLLTVPHGLWLLDHWSEVQQSVAADMVPEARSYLRSVWSGLSDLFGDSTTILLPLVILVFVYVWTRKKMRSFLTSMPSWKSFLPAQIILIQLLALLAFIFSGLLSDVNVRWLQPVWILLPFVLVYWLKQEIAGLKPEGLICWLGVWAVFLLFFHPLRNQGELLLGLTNRTHCDFEWLEQRLDIRSIEHNGFVTRGYFMAGNLRMHFPNELVLCNFWQPPEPFIDSMIMVVMHSEMRKGEAEEKNLLLDENECFQAWLQEEAP
ncbi:MAG TPA: glycosyltransferase family 39 protein, partial [Saprospiraceae bacterium]|nr:glycosyltransferase family 39 protein [Saprospiraceae bacterium]